MRVVVEDEGGGWWRVRVEGGGGWRVRVVVEGEGRGWRARAEEG